MNRLNTSLLCISCVVGLFGLEAATTEAMPYAKADFRDVTVAIEDDGGGLEHLFPKWGFSEKLAYADGDVDHKPRKKFELGLLGAIDPRRAHAQGPHSEAFVSDTFLCWGGILSYRHFAESQGEANGVAFAWSEAELYFEILGTPSPGDKIKISVEFTNAIIVEQDGGDADLSLQLYGALIGEPRWFIFDKPNDQIKIDPFSVDLGGFGEGEVVRFGVGPNVGACVPEPSSLALLLLGGLACLARRIG